MNYPKSLQPGTEIDDYEIKETLWTTNSGFIYRAEELDRDRDVLIQEYLPSTLATRHWSGIHAMPLEKLDDEFDQGLTQFLRGARTLAQINDPYVCRVYEYMETNATAYLVLDYEPGQTLKEHLEARKTPLDEKEIRRLLVPLLKGLRVAHAADLLHRDVHPANIYLRNVGPPVLIGFGSPVVAARDDSEQHIESRIAPGYSPVEQYQSEAELGPWSDLYALGATMYRCLSGATPVDATRRVTDIAQDKDDPLVPAMELGGNDYSAALLSAIDWMLEPMASDRPESAGAVLGPLTEDRSNPKAAAQAKPRSNNQSQTKETRQKKTGKKNTNSRPRKNSPQPTPIQYRDHSKRGAPPQGTAPEVPDKPKPETSPRLTLDVRDSRRRKKSIHTGWGWPLLVVLTGVSLVAYFMLSRPSPSQNVAVVEPPREAAAQTPEPPVEDEEAYAPEIPEKVNFGHKEDDQRAAEYRDLERRTQRIEQELATAERSMQQGNLVSPADDSALTHYRSILELDPDHADAKLGIASIQRELVKSAREAFSDRDLDEANRLLDQAAEVRQESEQGLALRRDIEDYLAEQARQEQLAREEERRRQEAEQRAEQERLEQIGALIEQGDSALARGRLTQPAGDSALAYYRRALRLDPDNDRALQGVERIGRQFLDQASEALAKDELDQADGLLNTAAAIMPDNESIPLLQKQLDTRRAVTEQNRRSNQERAEQAEQTRQAAAAAETAGAVEEPSVEGEQLRDLENGVAAYYAGDYDNAFQLLNPLAEKGDPRAKFRVAMMYYRGRSTTKDINLAETLIREALPDIRRLASQNTAWAQADLASLYADGIVLEESNREALRLYTLAAQQGYAGAQTNLGVMYANGEGVTPSREEAILWFRRAAAQGDRIAAKNLQALGVVQ